MTMSEGLVVTSSNESVVVVANDSRTARAVTTGSATLTASLTDGCGNSTVAPTTVDVSVVLELPVSIDLRLEYDRLAGEDVLSIRTMNNYHGCRRSLHV